jgi:hypothetical protein
VFKRKHLRPSLPPFDRLFWTILRRLWSAWAEALMIVRPETAVRWHRAGFWLHWRWRSRAGAPKLHGELLKLGFQVSERTVARYLRRVRRWGDPFRRWLTFLRNHRGVIVALDCFTVPTVTFQLPYCFFAIEQGRRRILPVNTKRHRKPTGSSNRLRQTFP